MDAGIIVALIASGSSLLIALWNTYGSSRQWKRERRTQAKAELARYRKPLLDAANELGARIHNIQCNSFGKYFRDPTRGDTALKSTLYRFARYFGTLEILRSEVSFLEFERANETKRVASLLAQIANALTSDRIDEAHFMIWREEQRAIGEVSIERDDDGRYRCIGFSTFVEVFDKKAARWFRPFQADLESDNAAATSERLAMVQALLQDLVRQLDEEERYLHKGEEPRWLKRTFPAP